MYIYTVRIYIYIHIQTCVHICRPTFSPVYIFTKTCSYRICRHVQDLSHTKFHMPNSISSSFFPIRPKIKYRFRVATLLLCSFPVAPHSLKDAGRLTYRRFLDLFRHMVGLLGRVISPSQGLYLHRTTQHRKTRTNIHVLSGIRTHDTSNQPAKTHASDRTATVTGRPIVRIVKYMRLRWAEHVDWMGYTHSAYIILVGKSDGMKPLVRPRRRSEHNIKMKLSAISCEDESSSLTWIASCVDSLQPFICLPSNYNSVQCVL
jgi:hypothetical protein